MNAFRVRLLAGVSLLAMVLSILIAGPVQAKPATPSMHSHAGYAEPKTLSAKAALTGAGYYYAGTSQSGVSGAKGVAAKVWVANPYVQCNSGEHSILEIAARDTVQNNTVEMGWVKDCATGGVPKLFIYYWQAGVPKACWFGCAAYVDNASNPIDAGADLSTVAAGCNGTTTLNCVKQFTFQYIVGSACGPAPNGVFFYYDNVNIGCLQSNAIPGTTSFDEYKLFGEVYYAGATVPCTDMGNGKWPTSTASATGAAYFGSASYTGTGAPTPSLSLAADTDSLAYTAVMVGTLNRTFTVGGYGRNASGGSPGNIGSC